MIIKTIGKYTINYERSLQFATVTIPGLIVREVTYQAEGVNCFAECEAWISNQSAGNRSNTLICADCPAPAELNRTRCASCQAKNRAKVARHRKRSGQIAGMPGRPRKTDAKPESIKARKYYEKRRDADISSNWADSLIRRLANLGHSPELGETWHEATERRYREHVAACVALDCLQIREPFEVFAREIVEAPSDAVRLSILAPMAMVEAPEPFRQYEQYVSPKAA